MRTLVWRSVRNNTGRYLATLIAIVTGVGFFAATGFISDRVIASLEGDVDRQYGNVDVAVTAKDDPGGGGVSPAADTGLKISGKAADRMESVDGVTGSAGVLTGTLGFVRASGKPGDSVTGRLWIADEELNPLDVVEGRGPGRPGEIAVDRGTAEDQDLSVGSRVKLLTIKGPVEARVVGITAFGDQDAADSDGTISVPEPTAFAWLNSGQVEYDELYLRGSKSQEALTEDVARFVPAGFEAQTGEAFLDDQRDQFGSIGRTLKAALQGFALLALFVGGFVIYNTFSVIVAQRLRELAVMAAIGATPKQIKRSLRYEGILIGLIGSVLGVIAGVVLTFVLSFVLNVAGVELPGSGLKISPTVGFQGIVLGTIITWLSVTIPARRAARTEPIEALRSAAADTNALSRRRGIAAAVLSGAGLVASIAGGSAVVIGLGALLLFIGVIVAGPFLAVGFAHLARPLLSRFGLEGRLAVDNTARNPTRTATTANALVIGVFLVTLVTVAGTSVKDFAVGEINKLASADYIVVSTGGSIDSGLVASFGEVDGVTTVTPFRREAVTIDGEQTSLSTGDTAAIEKVSSVEAAEGSLNDLRPGTIAVPESQTGGATPKLGSTVTVEDNGGEKADLEVVAVLKTSVDGLLTGALVDRSTFDDLVGDVAPTVAFIDVASGSQTDTKDALEKTADARPDIQITEGNSAGKLIGSIFDFVINAVNGLLLMSVLVALIGIVNTLSLSILERRRELGLLRVVGMTDDRVQRMVRLESVIIAGLGTAIGLVLGLVLAWTVVFSVDRLAEANIAFSVPLLQLLLVIVAGLVLGLLASLLPARRSTRLDVLEAIGAE
ncbi:MAG: FtsX-like permease family protein [Solirubrobacteraceae bacterium]|nr:FtsX-like permease family protein [Solirubrobacteraceae bacterium]